MSEIKTTIIEQLQQLQMLMHRSAFQSFMGGGRAYNPHRGQGRVLAILKMKPEISQKELTFLLGMSKQSIAELLVKLEKNGYIKREPSEEDKRVMNIQLTGEGMKVAENVDGSAPETEEILDCLNGEELSSFSAYLARIIARYEEQFPDEDFEQRRRSMEEFMSHFGHDRGFNGFSDPGMRHHGDRPHGFFGGYGRGHGHRDGEKEDE